MSDSTGSIPQDPASLAERLAAIPGLDRVRDAAAGTPIYLVGGAVRDLLLGRARSDLDLVVEGDAAAVARRLGAEVVSHERFATAKATVGGRELDFATARAESYPRPGALPEVREASLTDDLGRRDFTINAMAIPLDAEPRLIDPHGGRDDLERGVIRVLHAASIVDDPTRALRAARYAARFGFGLDPETERLVRAADLRAVSEDRVEAELLKLAAEPRARRGFELLDSWGLVRLPGGSGELIDAVATLLDAPPWQGITDPAVAVHAAATGRAPGAAGRSRDPLAAARELAVATVERPSEGFELARPHGEVELVLARAMGAAWLDAYLVEWRDVELEIGGEDLIAAGIAQGPAVGRGLAEALRRKLDGEVAGQEDELRVALQAARGEAPGRG